MSCCLRTLRSSTMELTRSQPGGGSSSTVFSELLRSCHICESQRVDVSSLLQKEECCYIAAPMVRYSKLAFRTLVRKYGCDLACTPMIIADSFLKSQKARDADFTTNPDDRPLIVQFAADNGKEFADAVEMVAPFADGADLNCGCPQRWAAQSGIGACLMNKPDLVADIIKQARLHLPVYPFSLSVKIRIHDDIRKTVAFCQQLEMAGATFITVHGRTAQQRCEPVNTDAVRLIKDSLRIPVVHNGDVRSLEDALNFSEQTGVDGVMAARGLLENPALYAGKEVDAQVVKDWIDIALRLGTPFQCFHHHLHTMLENCLPRAERKVFNLLPSVPAVIDYLNDYYFSPLDRCIDISW